MIKFFRHIRRSLIDQNQMGKPALTDSPSGRLGSYFKYAIGEILLVVIGILIALNINNWNDQRKLKLQEQTYYCKIAEDLQVDIRNIDSSLVTIDERLESAERFLKNLLKIQQDKKVLFKDFLSTVRYYKFIPTKAAIEAITSSGKLETLRNQSLKKRILKHYTEQDNAQQIIDINDNAHIAKLFEIERYADFGFQEFPQYNSIFDEELRGLLSSTQWQQNPKDELFVKIKDFMILSIIRGEREKELLKAIKADAAELNDLLVENCN